MLWVTTASSPILAPLSSNMTCLKVPIVEQLHTLEVSVGAKTHEFQTQMKLLKDLDPHCGCYLEQQEDYVPHQEFIHIYEVPSISQT